MGECWSSAVPPCAVMTSTKQVLNRWWHSTPQRLSHSLGWEFEILFFIRKANTCQKWQMGPKKFINVNQDEAQLSIVQRNAASWVKHAARWDNSTCFQWFFKRCFHCIPFSVLVQWPGKHWKRTCNDIFLIQIKCETKTIGEGWVPYRRVLFKAAYTLRRGPSAVLSVCVHLPGMWTPPSGLCHFSHLWALRNKSRPLQLRYLAHRLCLRSLNVYFLLHVM